MRALVISIIATACLSAVSTQEQSYLNHDYGFTLKVPPGVTVVRNKPPMPNHGFQLDLGEGQFISVYADYNGVEEPNTEEALLDWVTANYKPSFKKFCGGPVTIASLPGYRIVGTANADGDEKVVDYVKVERQVKGKTSGTKIRYYFHLRTSPKNYPTNALLLSKVIEGFRVRKID